MLQTRRLILIGLIFSVFLTGCSLKSEQNIGADVVAEQTIFEKLEGKTDKQRANIKSVEIAKINSLAKTSRGGYSIEIVSVNKTDFGIEVLARAWTRNNPINVFKWGLVDNKEVLVYSHTIPANEQIGFGNDGTVDIERFKVEISGKGKNGDLTYLVVPDSVGSISVDYSMYDPAVKRIVNTTVKYREDPLENLLRNLEHTIKVKQQKFDSSKIIAGKIGSTTSTFNPVSGANDPVDGITKRAGIDENFATIMAGAGTANGTSATFTSVGLFASGTTDQYEESIRTIALYDISSLGSDAIDSATESWYSDLSATGVGDTDFDITEGSLASPANVANGDYQNAFSATTRFATGIAISNWNVDSYTDYALNAAGITYLGTGTTPELALRLKWDVDNSFTGTWSGGALTRVRPFFADDADSNKHPKLVIEHSVAATGRTKRIINF